MLNYKQVILLYALREIPNLFIYWPHVKACGILGCQVGIKTEALAGRLPNLKSGLPENPQEILNLKTHFTCVH